MRPCQHAGYSMQLLRRRAGLGKIAGAMDHVDLGAMLSRFAGLESSSTYINLLAAASGAYNRSVLTFARDAELDDVSRAGKCASVFGAYTTVYVHAWLQMCVRIYCHCIAGHWNRHLLSKRSRQPKQRVCKHGGQRPSRTHRLAWISGGAVQCHISVYCKPSAWRFSLC
jgi:hypothetical protein